MDFQDKIHNQILGIKEWIHDHLNHHHKSSCECYHSADNYMHHIQWTKMMHFLPEQAKENIHLLCMKEHESFLSLHFKFAKKLKELEHKASILELDIKEHWVSKKNEFDKKVVYESLKELRKVKLEITDLIHEEKHRFMKSVKETEEKVFDQIQDFLKK